MVLRRLIDTLRGGSSLATAAQRIPHPDEAQARKARSITLLERAGVPFLPSLPVIDTEATSLRRSERAVAERLVALTIVAVKGETGDAGMGHALVDQLGAKTFLSPEEAVFIADPAPSPADCTKFCWRYEGAWLLLWALRLIDDPGLPSQIADVPRLAALMRDLGLNGVLKKGRLRPQGELLDAADLIFRRHWAIRQTRLEGEMPQPGPYADVVYERHYTLNWLIGYTGADWDDIPTDT